MIRKLLKNARIFTPCDPGTPLTGKDQGEVRCFEKGALLCRDGIIEAIGEEEELKASLMAQEVDVEVDCKGHCLIPGFVDPHTHMCFAKRREEEFTQRIQGMEYLEILLRGGGILSSVRAVRGVSEEELFSVTMEHALSALRFGTTTLEIKSGYGLETETELKMLRVIDRLGRETPLDVVPTFLGAHAVPDEYAQAPDDYVNLVIQEMIPAVSRQGIARFCDVFCEKGVFSVDQSRRILKAANENLQAMAEQVVIGVLLPGTAYSLQKGYASARKMVDLGIPVALATDCNPGSSYTESMPFIFGLAVLNMNLSVSEALVAATLNAAYAVGMAKEVGSLDVGKCADFLLLDGDSPAILAYHAGVSPVIEVYKRGEIVARN